MIQNPLAQPSRRRQRQNILLAFLLSLGAVAAAYALLGFAPFGDGTMLTGDLNGLYVAYITDLWRRVRQGGLGYSFAKLCGGSTLGLFAYYMDSPFNLLYLIFPVRAIPYVAQGVFALRTALTGAAACFYFGRHFRSDSRLVPVLSLGYSLCAFCVVYSQNIIWMDVVLLAPLLLSAVDALQDTGRHWPLTALVLLAALFNFYTAWEVCLFSVLYYLYRWFSAPRRGFWRLFGRFAASGCLGAGLAAFLLIPSLLEVEESKGGLFSMDFSLAPAFNLAQLPYRLFFGNFFWDDVTGSLPNLYCGVFAAALAVLFFAGAFPRREKIAAALLLAAMALSCWVQGLNLIWHGFKEPVWFPCRFSFLLSLFLLTLAGRALLAGRPGRRALLITAGAGLIWCAGYPLAAGETFSAAKLAACAAVFAATLAVILLRGAGRRALARAGAGLLALVALIDMTANTVLSLRKFEAYTVSGFETFYDENTAAVAAIRAADSGLYRIEKNFMRTLNDPMLLGYWGISHYSSTKASAAKPMLEALGYVNSSIYGWGSTGVADSLLGIKYLYSDGSRPVPGHYDLLATDTTLTVYENPFALPLAYVGASAALEIEIDSTDNTFALQNETLRALVPGTADALVPAAIEFSQSEQGIFLTFPPACDGPVYLALPGLDEATPADVRVDGELIGEYFTMDSLGGVMPLGSFAAGQQVEVYLGFADSAKARAAIEIYSLDETALASAVETLRAGAPQDLSVQEGGRIACTVTGSAEADLLVLPFAWEDAGHWQLTVNGEEAELEPVFGGMMGVRLAAGENTVTLRYRHPGEGAGLAVSAAFAAAALAWAVWERRRARKGDAA